MEKIVKNRFMVLLAEKAHRDGVSRIPVKHAAKSMGVSYNTLRAIGEDTIQEYPKDVLAKLCIYLGCQVGDLLVLEEQ